MRIRLLALATLLSAFPLVASAAETYTFDIFGRGNVHTATAAFTIDKPKDGLKTHTRITTNTSLGTTTTIDDYKATPDGNFVMATASKSDVNLQTTYATNKTHDALTISSIQNQQPGGRRDLKVQIPSFLLVLPDDPGVWQIVLDSAAAHPHADNVYYLFLPSIDVRTHDRLKRSP